MANAVRPAEIDDPLVLIRIPQLFRVGMSDKALYEATRGHWKVGERRDGAEYVLAVHLGVVLEAYAIERWQPAGTSLYATRPQRKDPEGRWEFVGDIAPHAIRSKYVGRSVKEYLNRGNQNPIHYVNC
ncbi:MAG: hypothetical protein ABIQ05_09895 [Candidatus Limnocylindria bacterium]